MLNDHEIAIYLKLLYNKKLFDKMEEIATNTTEFPKWINREELIYELRRHSLVNIQLGS